MRKKVSNLLCDDVEIVAAEDAKLALLDRGQRSRIAAEKKLQSTKLC